MTVYKIDPTADRRWPVFLESHPDASIFHTPEWLETLRRTYGYEPVVFTTSPPGVVLTNGLAFCRITSWLGAHRLVSLPFSDHCAPLVDSPEQLKCLVTYLEQNTNNKNWDSIEMRGGNPDSPTRTNLEQSEMFCFHKLDLGPSLDDLFRGFHKDCIQRKIKRAAREGLAYEEGRSESLLTKFYHLLLQTRRRHGLPPQPIAWFRNLIACLGDKVKIRVASKDSRPVASILTLRYKNALVYKYGCSDESFNSLGGMAFLFWNAIQEAKHDQLSQFDMGRSDSDNPGLIAFKDRWGAAPSTLIYWRYPLQFSQSSWRPKQLGIAKRVFPYIPDGWLAAAGRVLYKHMG